MMGGMSGQANTGVFDDLYVLTIPGFVWFKANYTTSTPRYAIKCATTGNSQMIVVGGLVVNDSLTGGIYDRAIVDPWPQGIGVIDLPTMSLKSSYDAHAPAYVSPQVVRDWYLNGFVTARHSSQLSLE
jgi:hypothetical protein